MTLGEPINIVDAQKIMDYNETWYLSLSTATKKEVLRDAIRIFPYLADHMRINKIKASDAAFTSHYCFKLMTDVLRKK